MQEFAWPEEDLPKRKAERGSSLSAETAAELAKEPMFCFEARSLSLAPCHGFPASAGQGFRRTPVQRSDGVPPTRRQS